MLPHAHGSSVLRGRIAPSPRISRSTKCSAFVPDGEGPHALVWFEKSGANTQWVATQLARARESPHAHVGYSGLKDRRAITRQALHAAARAHGRSASPARPAREGFRVLDAQRHTSGSSGAGRIVPTDSVSSCATLEGAIDSLAEPARAIRRAGVPNYFGSQTLRPRGGQPARAREWCGGGAVPAERLQRGFALSAARSWLSHIVVAERVRRG
jgi:tRNA pseudouridine13 synthase